MTEMSTVGGQPEIIIVEEGSGGLVHPITLLLSEVVAFDGEQGLHRADSPSYSRVRERLIELLGTR